MSIGSDKKRFPTCVIFECNLCNMRYPINHNFLMVGITDYVDLHICPDCEKKYGSKGKEGYAHIPYMEYELPDDFVPRMIEHITSPAYKAKPCMNTETSNLRIINDGG